MYSKLANGMGGYVSNQIDLEDGNARENHS